MIVDKVSIYTFGHASKKAKTERVNQVDTQFCAHVCDS